MNYTYDQHNYTLKFDRGEEFVSELSKFVKDQNIKGGWVMGLGGLAWAELGFYDLKAQEYKWRKLDLGLELLSLNGNITWVENEPALHLHASVSDAGLQTYGGHLKAAVVAGTVEIFIHRWLDDGGLTRSKDKATGLTLLDL